MLGAEQARHSASDATIDRGVITDAVANATATVPVPKLQLTYRKIEGDRGSMEVACVCY